MPVFARLAVFIVAAGLLGAPAAPAYAHENEALKRIQRAMQDVFSGKVFEKAIQQVREAQRRHALKAAGYSKNLPFYVPDSKTAKKPNVKPVKNPVSRKRPASAALPKKKPAIANPQVKQAQAALNELGFDAGKPDGLFGRKTAKAVERYQELIYHPVTGKLTGEERTMLLAAAKKKRQMAVLQKSDAGKGTMSYTVVNKTPSGLPRSPTATPRTDKKLVTNRKTASKKTVPPLLPSGKAEGAKSALPTVGDENDFDADDPEG